MGNYCLIYLFNSHSVSFKASDPPYLDHHNLVLLCAACICPARAARVGAYGPDSAHQRCCERAGQPAVPQDEKDPLPGGPQWPCGRGPRRRGGQLL